MIRLSIKKLVLLLLLFIPLKGMTQILKKATWQYHLEPENPNAGEEAVLVFNVVIASNWYMYSTDFELDPGPVRASFEFEEDDSYQLMGEIVPVGAKKKYDDIFEGDVTLFTGTAEFRQKIKVLSEGLKIKGIYEYQVCSEVDGKCILEEGEFEVRGKSGANTSSETTEKSID